MPGETPDYGVLSANQTVYPVTDLSELAVRLGAIPSIDRTGDVIFADSFEDGLNKWSAGWGMVAGAVRTSMETARSGRYSALLSAGVAAGAEVNIAHYLPLPVLSNLGLEAHSALDSNSDLFFLTIVLYTGASLVIGILQYDFTAKEVRVYNPVGGYTTIATGVNLMADHKVFHAFKLVIDPISQTYLRAIIDSTTYNLSAHGLFIFPAANDPMAEIHVNQKSNVAALCDVYVDDVIATQNEVA